MYLKRTISYGFIALLLLLLTACDTSSTGRSSGNANATPTRPAVVQGTSLPSTPGVGPTVILTPTRVPGGNINSQFVTLADRTLTITNIIKQAGTGSDLVAISLTMTIKDTGAKPIMNQATYFQLASAEGDAFGMQSSANGSFFGTIAPQSSRSGTIVFQVPTGAVNGLRLLYRPEVTADTVFVPLNL